MRPAVSIGGLPGPESLSLPLFEPKSEQHDAANPDAAPLSDDDFRRLFRGDPSAESDLSLLEGGLSLDLLHGGDPATFPFDSLVDFDPEPVELDGLDTSISFPDSTSCKTASVQPSFGASTQRCDEQGIAAGGE